MWQQEKGKRREENSSSGWSTALLVGTALGAGLATLANWFLSNEKEEPVPQRRAFQQSPMGPSGCSICLTSSMTLKCGHRHCASCISAWIKRQETCPDCRAVLSQEEINEIKREARLN